MGTLSLTPFLALIIFVVFAIVGNALLKKVDLGKFARVLTSLVISAVLTGLILKFFSFR